MPPYFSLRPLVCCGVFAFASQIAACSSDGTPDAVASSGNPYVVLLDSGANQGTLSTLNSVSAGASISGQGISVLPHASLFRNAFSLLALPIAEGDAVRRFELNSTGQLVEAGVLNVPAGVGASHVVWENDDSAFMSYSTGAKVVQFNPRTMAMSGVEINLSDSAYVYPNDPTGADKDPNPSAMVIRGGELYVALFESDSSLVPNPSYCVVAGIDLATRQATEIFYDTQGLSGCGRPGEPDSMLVDEDDDIYVYAGGGLGHDPTQSHGFLRIPSQQSRFDPDYFFDLNQNGVVGLSSPTDYCQSLRYAGNGLVYCTAHQPDLDTNPSEPSKNFSFAVIEINLRNMSARAIGMPLSNGTPGPGAIEVDPNRVIVGLVTESGGAGFYTYDRATKVSGSSPIVASSGIPRAIRHLHP